MDAKTADTIIESLGVDPERPVISQVSRFDPWKDPLGVIEAYRLAKNQIPGLQLVLAGIMTAADDPEAKAVLKTVQKNAKGDPDIRLFWNTRQLKKTGIDQFVNAVFTSSITVLQMSIKEGFGLTITEAMWKGKAIIGGSAQGVRLQIKNRANGLIVNNPLEAANAIILLINNPKLRLKLGRAANASVRKKFLFPRFLLENLKTYNRIPF